MLVAMIGCEIDVSWIAVFDTLFVHSESHPGGAWSSVCRSPQGANSSTRKTEPVSGSVKYPAASEGGRGWQRAQRSIARQCSPRLDSRGLQQGKCRVPSTFSGTFRTAHATRARLNGGWFLLAAARAGTARVLTAFLTSAMRASAGES